MKTIVKIALVLLFVAKLAHAADATMPANGATASAANSTTSSNATVDADESADSSVN